MRFRTNFKNFFQRAGKQRGKGCETGYVVIPFGYEKLSADEQSAIVPICIPRWDEEGAEIAAGWHQAVADVQDGLRDLARRFLEDVWRVSELAEATVLSLWHRYGDQLGLSPGSQVLAEAKWAVRDVQSEGWQWRRGVVIALEELGELTKAKLLMDRSQYDELYANELHFKVIGEQLEEAGHEGLSMMLKLVRDGCTWPEIGERTGRTPDAARMHFWRWMDRLFPGAGRFFPGRARMARQKSAS